MLFKKGDTKEGDNYRSINFLSILAKLFSAIILGRHNTSCRSQLYSDQKTWTPNCWKVFPDVKFAKDFELIEADKQRLQEFLNKHMKKAE